MSLTNSIEFFSTMNKRPQQILISQLVQEEIFWGKSEICRLHQTAMCNY